MFERIYLEGMLILFLFAFITRNIVTYISVKQSIRGKSLKLALSIALSTIIYLLIILKLSSFSMNWDIEFHFIKNIDT